jgi:hypothetical protein
VIQKPPSFWIFDTLLADWLSATLTSAVLIASLPFPTTPLKQLDDAPQFNNS